MVEEIGLNERMAEDRLCRLIRKSDYKVAEVWFIGTASILCAVVQSSYIGLQKFALFFRHLAK